MQVTEVEGMNGRILPDIHFEIFLTNRFRGYGFSHDHIKIIVQKLS